MGVAETALKSTAYAVAGLVGSYLAFLGVLTIPFVQNQVIYLNKVTLTWGMDVNYPEQWGFLHNQVTPFNLNTRDGETLHAWHILPPGAWEQNSEELLKEPTGLVDDITTRKGFQMLRDDPEALLVLYFHGAAGTLGSGYRPPSYRAIWTMGPNKIHTVAIDYRGFGTSSGTPSEEGLKIDAQTLVDWALQECKIPPGRIVLFAQSMGTAATISWTQAFREGEQPHHSSRAPLFSKSKRVSRFQSSLSQLVSSLFLPTVIPSNRDGLTYSVSKSSSFFEMALSIMSPERRSGKLSIPPN